MSPTASRGSLPQRGWVLAGLATAVSVLVAVALLTGRPGAEIAPPPERWTTQAVPVGQSARVGGPEKYARRCIQATSAVVASGDDIWTSDLCPPGAGDDDAPPAEPDYAIDHLWPDGTVERLDPVVVDGVPQPDVTLEAVGPDGVLWARSGPALLRRSTDGRWQRAFEIGDAVDVQVGADGRVHLADSNLVAVLRADGTRRTLGGEPGAVSDGQPLLADEDDAAPRPAVGSPLLTLTGITLRRDGTVVVLATDTILTIDPAGALATLVSPRSSGTDPATRLVRAVE